MSPDVLKGAHLAGIITGRMTKTINVPFSGLAIDMRGNTLTVAAHRRQRRIYRATFDGIVWRLREGIA